MVSPTTNADDAIKYLQSLKDDNTDHVRALISKERYNINQQLPQDFDLVRQLFWDVVKASGWAKQIARMEAIARKDDKLQDLTHCATACGAKQSKNMNMIRAELVPIHASLEQQPSAPAVCGCQSWFPLVSFVWPRTPCATLDVSLVHFRTAARQRLFSPCTCCTPCMSWRAPWARQCALSTCVRRTTTSSAGTLPT